MEYVYTTDPTDVIDYVYNQLVEHLEKDEAVIWLVSGGSAIDTAVAVSDRLSEYDITKLSVSLVDERFGVVGHENENWQQLLDKGFHLPTSELHRPLIGQDRATTSEAFGEWLKDRLTDADYSIALFGIGSDGHTAGIKPGSPAVKAEGWTADYTWKDFERITMTFNAIKKLDLAVLQVNGDNKFPALHQLLNETVPLDTQPAQIFKEVKKSILFTDYKEENS
jgi:6-phosphogluconolactonase/glucosamine-6-phosphate isomerase/deaminase